MAYLRRFVKTFIRLVTLEWLCRTGPEAKSVTERVVIGNLVTFLRLEQVSNQSQAQGHFRPLSAVWSARNYSATIPLTRRRNDFGLEIDL